jgi:hypothetical protein
MSGMTVGGGGSSVGGFTVDTIREIAQELEITQTQAVRVEKQMQRDGFSADDVKGAQVAASQLGISTDVSTGGS